MPFSGSFEPQAAPLVIHSAALLQDVSMSRLENGQRCLSIAFHPVKLVRRKFVWDTDYLSVLLIFSDGLHNNWCLSPENYCIHCLLELLGSEQVLLCFR